MDHDQFFKRMMHLFLREFFELFFVDWLHRFDFDRVEWLEQEVFPDPPRGEKRVVDILAKLPTFPSDPPEENEPKDSLVLVHIEVESRDSVGEYPKRMYDYYTKLTEKYDHLEVLPIAIFLSVGLDGLGTGVYKRGIWKKKTLTFEYDYVGLPALSGEDYLHGKNMLGVAWSCVMHMARDRRPEAAAEALRMIEASRLTPEQKMTLMDFIHSYSPLKEEEWRDLNDLLVNPKMENAMQFRKTWTEEARDEGVEIGKRQLVERLLEARFNRPLDEVAKTRLQGISGNRLETLAIQVSSASSLKELGLED